MTELISDILTLHFLYALGIVFLGGLMHGYTGWGGGMVMMPLMTLLFPPVESLGLICVGGILLTAQMYPAALRIVNWREMRPLYIALLIMTPMGGVLLLYLDPGLVRRIIGIAVVVAAILIMSGWQYRGRRGASAAAAFGSAAGLANGFAGVGGPPFVIYVLSHPDGPGVQRANIVIGAGLQIMLITLTLTVTGAIGWEILVKGVILAPPQLIAGMIGGKIFALAPQEHFRKFTLAAIVVLGASVALL